MKDKANAYIVRMTPTAAILAAAAFLSVFPLAAAATSLSTATEPPAQERTTLWPVQDQADMKEIKREALGRIVAFTRSEAEQLLAKISRVGDEHSEFKVLEARFTDSLNRMLDQIGVVENELAVPQLTLADIENKAAEFGEWRTSYYDPIARGAIDLVIVSQNEHALATAGARFTKISETVRKAGFLKTNDFLDTLLKKAANELRAGRELHGKAFDALRRMYLAPEKKRGAELLPADEGLARPETMADEDPIPVLIQESLAHTRNAYDAFIKIGRFLTVWQKPSN